MRYVVAHATILGSLRNFDAHSQREHFANKRDAWKRVLELRKSAERLKIKVFSEDGKRERFVYSELTI
jgi:hypothetical protein